MFCVEDFVENTRSPGFGEVGVEIINSDDLQGAHWDSGLRRPYLENGHIWVDVTVGHKPKQDKDGNMVYNRATGLPVMEKVVRPERMVDRLYSGKPVLQVNNATVLRKDQWIALDATVGQAIRARLKAWADLRGASTLGGFDGMSTPILEREIATDPGEAVVDMEGIAEGRNFQHNFALQGIPLPITHSDFWLSERFLAVSRRKGQPQDTLRAETAAFRVAETIEQTLIGLIQGTEWGDSTDYASTSKVYGYMTHPDRITYTSLPTSSALTSAIDTTSGVTFNKAVVAMIKAASDQNIHGPFVLYISPAYDDLLDHDFKANSDLTIRQRALQNDKITSIRRLDYLTGDVMILVQMTSNFVQAVNGLEVTTVQWDSKGGMQKNFKVMAIQVPLIKSVYKSGTTTRVTGIVHGTTS